MIKKIIDTVCLLGTLESLIYIVNTLADDDQSCWLVIAWWLEEPGHQQPWLWPKCCIFWNIPFSVRNGSNHRGLTLWWSFLGRLFLCPIFKCSHCNSFEEWAPVEFIYGCPIFRWVVGTWLHDRGPVACITNVIATCRKNFSQWESSFLWKLRCHWLKFLRHVAKTLVIQGPDL